MTTNERTNRDEPLIETLEVWWDAVESDDPRADALWAPILAAAVAHATAEGTADAEYQAGDLDPPDHYEPGSDAAYLNAVGRDEILKEIGLGDLDDRGFDVDDIWDLIAEPWCTAFEAAVEATFERYRNNPLSFDDAVEATFERYRNNPLSFDDARKLVDEIAAKYDGSFREIAQDDQDIIRDLVLEHGGDVASFVLWGMPSQKKRPSAPRNATRQEHDAWLRKWTLPFEQWTQAQWANAIQQGLYWVNIDRKAKEAYDAHRIGAGASWGAAGAVAYSNEVLVREALVQAAEELGADEALAALTGHPLAVVSSLSPIGAATRCIQPTARVVYVFSDGQPSLDPEAPRLPERDGEALFKRASRILREKTGDDWSYESYSNVLQYFLVYPENAMHRPRRNPASSTVRDKAVAKYKEFWRQEPTKVGEFGKAFKIPTHVHKLGRAMHVLYESLKTDPETMKEPKTPISYIHEHDWGVNAYDTHGGDTKVPDFIANTDALVLLGACLGFQWRDEAGNEHDAEGTSPLPDLWCTPDGHALLVIQSRRTVLQIIWGGSLAVEARGIVH